MPDVWVICTVIAIVAILVLAILAFVFYSAHKRRLEKIAVAMQELQERNYDVTIFESGSGPVGVIEASLNSLAVHFRDLQRNYDEYTLSVQEEDKIWKERLEEVFEEVNRLKQQQDGDYFLTSLLTAPLGAQRATTPNVTTEIILEQKKKFEFRQWSRDIGGDTCITDTLSLKGKKYSVFLNADAMGKSMQGAGGVLVLGSVFHSILERTKLSPQAQNVFPEQWLKYMFVELHRIFEVFDGSMLISLVVGLIDDETGVLYYLNAEHPWPILYRNGETRFIGEKFMLRKLGMLGVSGSIEIATEVLQPNDVLIVASDGRDDILLLPDADGKRTMNADEKRILRLVQEARGDLSAIRELLCADGDITDDLSLMRIAYREGEATRAEKASHRLHETRNNIRSFMKIKQFDRAAELAESHLSQMPADSEFLLIASYCHKLLKNYERAADFGERLHLRERYSITNLVNLADIYLQQGNFERSKALTDSAAQLEPENRKVKQLSSALANRKIPF